MRSTRSLVTTLAFCLVAALAGCGKKQPAQQAAGSGAAPGSAAPSGPTDPRVTAIIAKSKELRDRACACTDGPCAAGVRADHDQWLHDQLDEYAKLGEPKSTKAQEEEASKWQHELFECLGRLPGPNTPSSPVPSTGSAAPAAGSAAPAAGSAAP